MTARDEGAILAVEGVGARGDGIALHGGRPVYLPFAAPGDRVRAVLGSRRGEGRTARVIEVLASGARLAPVCPHFGSCGGCALQHLPVNVYAAAKEGRIRAALAQHGVVPDEIAPLRRLAPGTRRRARVAIRRTRDPDAPALVGFNIRTSHQVVDMRDCAVLHPALVALVAPLRDLAPALCPPGSAGAATATAAETGVDLLLDLAVPPGLPELEKLAHFAEAQDLARLAWRGPGETEAVPLALRRPVRVTFAGITVELPAEAFLQASAEADAVLTRAVVEELGAARRIADLYAGVGTFTFALAQRAAVHAVEDSGPAVAALAAAAVRAGLGGRVTAERRDLDVGPLLPSELARYDAVLLDPPRAGARAQSAALAASAVPCVIAVSCNPATFARDARSLVDGGYRLRRVEPIDQFVWSPHVELVARFERASRPDGLPHRASVRRSDR